MNGDLIKHATFHKCVFVNCRKKNSDGIKQLDGCSGYFVGNSKTSINDNDIYPSLWNPERASKAIREFKQIRGKEGRGKREDLEDKRIKFLSTQKFPHVLAICNYYLNARPGILSLVKAFKLVDASRSNFKYIVELASSSSKAKE